VSSRTVGWTVVPETSVFHLGSPVVASRAYNRFREFAT
jgi:DMSO reductase anchor subunit